MIKNIFFQSLAILLIVFTYFFIDFKELLNIFETKTNFVLQENCNLHKKPCIIMLEDGTSLTLEVFPKSIPVFKPLVFKVKSSNHFLEDTSLNIYSTSMFMGYFNFKLKNLGKGVYEAKGVLPLCPRGTMKWNIDLEIKNKTIGARYQFETE